MANRKKLPVGIENFEDFSTNDFYYVDKTGLIIELLHNWGKVNLFTRPRRFGKTLNMSMLQHFFEIGCDKSLFDGQMGKTIDLLFQTGKSETFLSRRFGNGSGILQEQTDRKWISSALHFRMQM